MYYSDSLNEAGYEVSDKELAYAMLIGLPDSYEAFVMTLSNVTAENLKSIEVKNMLLTEYEQREARNEERGDDVKEVNYQASSKQQKVKSEKVNPVKKKEDKSCFKCGKSNYLIKDCKYNVRKDKKCYYCGKQGHLANVCWHKGKSVTKNRIMC